MAKNQPERIIDQQYTTRAVRNATGNASYTVINVLSHGELGDLGVDDHLQYLLSADAGGRPNFLAKWTDLTDGGNATAHTHSHTILSDIGSNTHSQIDTHISASDIHVAHSGVSVIAGDGLTGGGTIAADRTLNVAVANTIQSATATGLSVEANAVRFTASYDPGATASPLASSATGSLTLPLFVASTSITTPSLISASLAELSIASGADTVFNPTGFVRLASGKLIRSNTFTSGFAGSGWQIDDGIITASKISAEFDNLTIRGRLSVYELLVRQIRATNGSVFVSSTGKAKTVTFNSGVSYTITTDNPDNHGFLEGDLIRAQRFTGTGVYQCDLHVTSVSDIYTFTADLIAGDAPAVGMDFVRLGSSSDASRRGSVYLTADDSGAPFIDIVDGITSHSDWNSRGGSAGVKARFGRITGITGNSNEYGIWAGSGTGDTAQSFVASNAGVTLNNVVLDFKAGTSTVVMRLSPGSSAPFIALGSTLPTGPLVNDGIWLGKDTAYKFRVGTVSGGALVKGLYWDGADLIWKATNTSLDASGNLVAGPVTLSSTGVTSAITNAFANNTAYKFTSGGNVTSGLWAYIDTASTQLYLSANRHGGVSTVQSDTLNANVQIASAVKSGKQAYTYVDAEAVDAYGATVKLARIVLGANSTASAIDLNADTVEVNTKAIWHADMDATLLPSADVTYNIGSATKRWSTIYANNLVISGSISGATIGGAEWEHTGSMVIDANAAANTTVSIVNQNAGAYTASLDVEGNITLGGNIDGVDLSGFKSAYDTHVGNADAHHARSHSIVSTSDHTASGLTTGYVLRASGATTFAWAAIADSDLPSTIVRTSRSITSGAGLTGGGDLSADRTLAVGAGLGITVNADDVALTTPGTLTAITTNSSTGSHTHAITSSSSPGASTSVLKTDASGYLQLVRLGLGVAPTAYVLDVNGTGRFSGVLYADSDMDVDGTAQFNGNLNVGTVLKVNKAGTRVGINCDADQQFDLDVAGPIRGTYLVGKHAIQLDSAVAVMHFDGAQPYNLDFTGSNASHMGVSGTVTGGVIHRPGKFGKAVQVAEGTTNLVPNPSFENASPSYNWSVTDATFQSYGLYGGVCLRSENVNQYAYCHVYLSPGTYTASVYVRGTGDYQFGDSSGNQENPFITGTPTSATEWQRISFTWTQVSSGNAMLTLHRWQYVSGWVEFDAVQLEAKAYATPYADGSLGTGHTWSGTAHASTSTRAASSLLYPINLINARTGTIMMWIYTNHYNPNGGFLWSAGNGNAILDSYIGSNGSIYFRIGGSALHGVASNGAGAWIHAVYSWDASVNESKLYLNGVLTGTASYTAQPLNTDFSIGSASAYAHNGLIDDLVILDYAAESDLIRTIYESAAPVFVASSVFHWRSPSRVPIWVDEFGLWAQGVSGNAMLGLYGGDPRNPTGNVTKSWGGVTMEEGDLVIGGGTSYVHWDASAAILKVKGQITADSGSIAGALTMGSSGSIAAGAFTLDANGLLLSTSGSENVSYIKFGATTGDMSYAEYRTWANSSKTLSLMSVSSTKSSVALTVRNTGQANGYNGMISLTQDTYVSSIILEASTTTVTGGLRIGGDPSGAASTIAFTNVTATATGATAYSFKMNGGTAYENSGWMKIYVGTSARYVPYWTSI